MKHNGPSPAGDLTGFLNALAHGDADATSTLMPHVYGELKQIAEAYLRRQPARHTLQPTALVHEAFLKLFRPEAVSWRDRSHFYALAAKAMRHLLVDHARARRRQKRGGGRQEVTLDEALALEGGFDVLDLHLALEDLGRLDDRQARVVELRYFGGLEVDEVAGVLEVSKSTVEREWRSARAWLGLRLDGKERA